MTAHTATEAFREKVGARTRASRAATFAPVLSDLRGIILRSSPEEIAGCSGAVWDETSGEFLLPFLGQHYRVTWPDLSAYPVGCSTPVSSHTMGLFLFYLALADGKPRAGRWISFRELPDGWLYHAAFQGYTGKILAPAIDNNGSALQRAAAAVGGISQDVGDVGFAFAALPNIHLAVAYWFGDDEFDAEAQVLFDASASHYLSTDGLAVLGSRLVQRLLEQL